MRIEETRIEREEAKRLLADKQARQVADDEKGRILEEYWAFDSEADLRAAIEGKALPKIGLELIALIAATPSPPSSLPPGIDPLIEDWKFFKLAKALNSFIEERLGEFGLSCKVSGDVEPAGLCPCCLHYSINPGEEGLWDICPVCFWENGGDGPNHMGLDEAQINFREIGAISEGCLEFVDPLGTVKYGRCTKDDATSE